MKAIFRVDASLVMGIGHVMRCLTLAKVLKENGVKVKFICRKHKGNLISKIRSNGFDVCEIGMVGQIKVNSELKNYNLLGVTQLQDAKDCIDILNKEKVNWIITDHYALDEIWHMIIRPYAQKIMVIDDLADRRFNCDVLLNQNLGSQLEDYENKVPNGCNLLLGCEYALLRPEFKELRGQALEKRKNTKKIKNILISMGGSDIENITYDVLQQLDSNFNVVVVLGGASPHNVMIENYGKDKNIKVIVNADNMAELMLEADLSIGASGSTNWERLCLGLPSLIFTVAENQIKFSKILDELGLIRLLGHVGERKAINVIKESILSIDDLSAWSERCFNSCSCDGVSKVVEIITNKSVSIA